MTKFAAQTTVGVGKSKAEIEDLLSRYGADEFAQATMPGKALILFSVAKRVRFVLPIPSPGEKRFTHKKPDRYGFQQKRTDNEALEAWEQEHRRIWRALCLVIKAKLEAVSSGIVTFETEFLAHFILPNGQTVSEHVAPTLLRIHESGENLPLLTGSLQ